MSIRQFDRKFGPEFLESVPPLPGVYRIFDQNEELIYVDKAKHLRRRLGQYRNAKRVKKHLKMRKIIKDAARISMQTCATELEASLLEAKLIQEHRPRWNVAGAFYFLYPMIGMRIEENCFYLCYTTTPELYPEFDFHGSFRSRAITREAFFALVRLLKFYGHRIPPGKIERLRRNRYSFVCGFRQIPGEWCRECSAFLRGESKKALEELVLALLENAGARKARRDVQAELKKIMLFWRYEAQPLNLAMRRAGVARYPVSQKERDLVFLTSRYGGPRGQTLAKPESISV